MRALSFAIGAVALLPLLSVLADPPKHEKASDQPPKHEKEVEAPGLMVSRTEVMKKDPVADLGVARYWAVEKGKDVWSLLVEVNGTIPLHFHPDGVHRMYVLEGKLKCTVGKETMEMGPGDYMLIPKGVRHKFEKGGRGQGVLRDGGHAADQPGEQRVARTRPQNLGQEVRTPPWKA